MNIPFELKKDFTRSLLKVNIYIASFYIFSFRK